MERQKRILVAPLNWGLGHATRCIPIIDALIQEGFQPIIASDGMALELLKLEFPQLEFVELPSYNISYSKKASNLKLVLLKQSPKFLKAISAEKKIVKTLVDNYQIDGVISDNRFGVYSNKVPTVFITHQLNVLSGSTTLLTSKLHQNIIKKFDECWVPDTKNEPNLSGKLGHVETDTINTKYMGVVSRLKPMSCKVVYDVLVLLSGPEPQRTLLESILMQELQNFKGKYLFVRGKVEKEQSYVRKGNQTIVNYLESKALEEALNRSAIVISRSGYSTVLDLAKLGKKAFFIPTPGQYEQEYLAKRFEEKGIVPYSLQHKFKLEMLSKIKNYSGFEVLENTNDFSRLFDLFKGKRELATNTKLTLNV